MHAPCAIPAPDGACPTHLLGAALDGMKQAQGSAA
jgi:hypothetical protein